MIGFTGVRPPKPTWYNKPERIKSLDEALEDIAVHFPGDWENEMSTGPLGSWYAVSTGDDGIIAYFEAEVDAFGFRLRIINSWLNGW